MKLMTRDTDYAVRALTYMAGKDKEVVSSTELVKSLKIPRQFLRGIMQELGKAGIVRSYKGIGGGFRLIRRPSSIYMTDVIRIFQGPLNLNECLFKKSICPNKGACILGRKLASISRYVESEIGSISISDLNAVQREEIK